MTTGRAGQTATLLADGRVLIAGGADPSVVITNCPPGSMACVGQAEILDSAELFDPKAGKFTQIGSMTAARAGQTATLLLDGRVLMAGGDDSNNSVTSAELYDPKTGRFTPTGSMSTIRMGYTATRLLDGRVLMAGGSSYLSGDPSSMTAELYDPKTGTFTPTGHMTDMRVGAAATLLRDGRVLIAGGQGPYGGPSARTADLYDPATDTFTSTGSMSHARNGASATLLGDGTVLIAGGEYLNETDDMTYEVKSAELYDPITGTFRPAGSQWTGSPTATLLMDGSVLFTGDVGAEIYDPHAGHFTTVQVPATVRNGGTATLLPNGWVLLAGGGSDSSLATAELFEQ